MNNSSLYHILSYTIIVILTHQAKGFVHSFQGQNKKCPSTSISNNNKNNRISLSSSLFSTVSSSSNNNDDNDNDDNKALKKKNEIRKKYNLEPISKEEYNDIQEQVNVLKAEQEVARELLLNNNDMDNKKSTNNNFFQNIIGGSSRYSNKSNNACESNYDCINPNEVCCDLLIKKVCCSFGIGAKKLALVRVTAN